MVMFKSWEEKMVEELMDGLYPKPQFLHPS